MSHIIGLIAAGGRGERSNSEIPKQFVTVNDYPVLVHTCKVFESINEVDEYALIVPSAFQNEIQNNWRDRYNLSKMSFVIEGGDTGQDSWFNGLQFLFDHITDSDTIIISHDGVRPYIQKSTILNCLNAFIQKKDSSIIVGCGHPILDSYGIFDEDTGLFHTGNLPKKAFWEFQTPTVFTLETMYSLFRDEGKTSFNTYESPAHMMMSLFPERVIIQKGQITNRKITFPEDLLEARLLLV